VLRSFRRRVVHHRMSVPISPPISRAARRAVLIHAARSSWVLAGVRALGASFSARRSLTIATGFVGSRRADRDLRLYIVASSGSAVRRPSMGRSAKARRLLRLARGRITFAIVGPCVAPFWRDPLARRTSRRRARHRPARRLLAGLGLPFLVSAAALGLPQLLQTLPSVIPVVERAAV